MTENPKTMKNCALAYLKSGKSLFPCGKNKRPLIPSWEEYQKTPPSVAEVENWWTQFPWANIALVTGKISNISVIDCDLGSDYTQFPKTITIKTGSGGYHLYYQYHEGLGNKTAILPNVDIRSDGGYVVAFPSITEDKIEDGILKKKGGRYEVINSEKSFSPFPSYIIGEKQAITKNWKSVLAGSNEGSRNQNASEIIGKLLNTFRVSEWEDVWELTRAWNTFNIPPLSENELRIVFNSICKREIGNRNNEIRPEDDVPVLPLFEVVKQNQKTIATMPTGLAALDNVLRGGIQEGDITIVSGSTGEGKTFLCQSITFLMAAKKIPSLWFSYEMPTNELWRKFEEMGAKSDLVVFSPLKNLTGDIDWIEKKIKEAKQKYGTKIVFLDHLGFLTKAIKNPNDRSLSANYALYLSSLCRDIKKMAIANEIAIFLLAHKTKDKGSDDTSDIAYSAGIAQEADTVLIIRREKSKNYNSEQIYTQYSWLNITKNRKTGITKKICLEKVNGMLAETIYEPARYKKEDSILENVNKIFDL